MAKCKHCDNETDGYFGNCEACWEKALSEIKAVSNYQPIEIDREAKQLINESHQNLETYIEAYLRTSPRNIDELVLVEQRSHEGSGIITVRWWLEPKEK